MVMTYMINLKMQLFPVKLNQFDIMLNEHSEETLKARPVETLSGMIFIRNILSLSFNFPPHDQQIVK